MTTSIVKRRSNRKRKTLYDEISLLKRQARLNKPELKRIVFALAQPITAGNLWLQELTAIAQGTGINQRVGSKIVVRGFDIRAFDLAPQLLDQRVVMSVGNYIPTFTVFKQVVDGHINESFADSYRELGLMRNYSGANNFERMTLKNLSIECTYNGSGSDQCHKNRLHYVVRNFGTESHTITYSIIVYYIDA